MTNVALAYPPVGVDEVAWLAACAAVRSYCGWHVAPSITETVTVDGAGGDFLLLPTLHLTALHSITSDGVGVVDPEWSGAGMVRGPGWSRRLRGVVANITHGYDECPAEVLAVLSVMVEQGGSSPSGAERLTNGPFTMQVSAAAQAGAVGLSGQHRGVLNKYRLGPVP